MEKSVIKTFNPSQRFRPPYQTTIFLDESIGGDALAMVKMTQNALRDKMLAGAHIQIHNYDTGRIIVHLYTKFITGQEMVYKFQNGLLFEAQVLS